MAQFLETIQNILKYQILNNTVQTIVIAVITYFIIRLLLKKWVGFTQTHIKNYLKKNKDNKGFGSLLLDIIQNMPKYFFIILEIYIPLNILNFTNTWNEIIKWFFLFIVLLQVIRILNRIIIYSIKGMFTHKGKVEQTSLNALQLVFKIVLRTIGWLLLLSNLNIEITPLIASLGVGWIAIAFALQNILQDFFSSFSIILSRPFKVWDYIIIWEKSWTVTEITLKATHIKTTMGYEVRIPNTEILAKDLENRGRMKYRRIRFDIWVEYKTPTKKLKIIPEMIELALSNIDNIEYERTKLSELASYSIKFTTSYVIWSPAYAVYIDVRQSVLLNILEKLEKEKIKIAFPTQVIITKE